MGWVGDGLWGRGERADGGVALTRPATPVDLSHFVGEVCCLRRSLFASPTLRCALRGDLSHFVGEAHGRWAARIPWLPLRG